MFPRVSVPITPAPMPLPGAEGVLYLIDLTGWCDRAWHVAERAWGTKTGRRCEVVKSVAHALVRLLTDWAPAYVAAAVDAPPPSFRHLVHPTYKAKHPPKASDYQAQLRWSRDLLAEHAIPVLSAPGFEAEDVIATLTKRAVRLGLDVVIVGRSRALWPLIREPTGQDGAPGVVLWNDRDEQGIGARACLERFGVPPGRLVDALALAGHPDDSIPGVQGVGTKTAAELLDAYGSLDGVLARAREVTQPKRREALLADADLARLSRDLVRLRDDAPVPFDLAAMRLGGFQVDALRARYADLDLAAYGARVEAFPKDPVDPVLLRRSATLAEMDGIARRAGAHGEAIRREVSPLPPEDALRAFWHRAHAKLCPPPEPVALPPPMLSPPRRRPVQLDLFPL